MKHIRIKRKRCAGAFSKGREVKQSMKLLSDHVQNSYHNWAKQAMNPPPLTFCDLFDRFLQVTDDFKKEIFAVAAWCLWNRRNALHFGRQV